MNSKQSNKNTLTIQRNKTWKTPGFWDFHIHGVGEVDFMRLSRDPTTAAGQLARASKTLYEQGIDGFAPTLLTASWKDLIAAVENLAVGMSALAQFEGLKATPWKGLALPVGIHLEGPFLSPKASGAHPTKNLRVPSAKRIKTILDASQGWLSIVTLAPELKGALSAIRYLTNCGVRVQLGHSTAGAKIAGQAQIAGALGLTHLYNAMRVHHRDPGVLAPLLDEKATFLAEIITDGVHLQPDFIGFCVRGLGARLYAVSDCCSNSSLGKVQVRRVQKKGKLAYAVTAKQGILAGGSSCITEHPAVLRKVLGPGLDHELLELGFARAEAVLATMRHKRVNQNAFARLIRSRLKTRRLQFNDRLVRITR